MSPRFPRFVTFSLTIFFVLTLLPVAAYCLFLLLKPKNKGWRVTSCLILSSSQQYLYSFKKKYFETQKTGYKDGESPILSVDRCDTVKREFLLSPIFCLLIFTLLSGLLSRDSCLRKRRLFSTFRLSTGRRVYLTISPNFFSKTILLLILKKYIHYPCL